MKQGLVVYLTGASEVDDSFDEEKAFAELGFDSRMTLLAASASNYYDVMDATKILLERGAGRVEVAKAALEPGGKLRIFGEPLRLYG